MLKFQKQKAESGKRKFLTTDDTDDTDVSKTLKGESCPLK